MEKGQILELTIEDMSQEGNGIGKAMTYFAGAKSAGIVVGAKAPIVLVSRSDNAEAKLLSIALAAMM